MLNETRRSHRLPLFLTAAGLLVLGAVSSAQQSAIVRGRVQIGIPIAARRPTSSYPTRAVAAPKLAPESERQHVVIYLKDARPQPVTPMRASMHQHNESFTPRVIAVTVGSEVEFPNDDPIY